MSDKEKGSVLLFLLELNRKPAQLLHMLPLFNPLSGYGSYIVPAVVPLIIHQTILLGLSMLVAGWRETGWRLRWAASA